MLICPELLCFLILFLTYYPDSVWDTAVVVMDYLIFHCKFPCNSVAVIVFCLTTTICEWRLHSRPRAEGDMIFSRMWTIRRRFNSRPETVQMLFLHRGTNPAMPRRLLLWMRMHTVLPVLPFSANGLPTVPFDRICFQNEQNRALFALPSFFGLLTQFGYKDWFDIFIIIAQEP